MPVRRSLGSINRLLPEMVIKIARINFTATALTFFDGSSARYFSLPGFSSAFCQLDHCIVSIRVSFSDCTLSRSLPLAANRLGVATTDHHAAPVWEN